MNSIYIDANASNSKIIDSTTNNRWEYQINGGLSLPTGTNISVASSFINQKGIAGGSIEIEEDIEEELVYGYYLSDSQYSVPATGNLMDDPDEANNDNPPGLDIMAPFNFLYNWLDLYTNDGDTDYTNAKWAPSEERGRTENIMPLMTLARTTAPPGHPFKQKDNLTLETDGWSYAIPLLSKTTLKIKKGIYTLEKLADIINAQLNGSELPDNLAKTRFQKDKEDGTFDGQLTNRGFARQVKVEHTPEGFSGELKPDGIKEEFDFNGGMMVRNHYQPRGGITQVDNVLNYESKMDGLEFTGAFTLNLTPAQMSAWYAEGGDGDTQTSIGDYFLFDSVGGIRALTASDTVIPSVFAVRPKFFQEGIDYLKQDTPNCIPYPNMTPTTNPATNGVFHYNIGDPQGDPSKFAPSLFAYRSDVLAANFNTQKGAHSQYCFGFENNSVVPPYTQFGAVGQGRFPSTMYFQDTQAAPPAGRGTSPSTYPFFNTNSGLADFNVFNDTNFFPNGAMTVGTTNFQISYDSQSSLYKMSHLHEPRKIPSYDKLGNKLDNPSSECYYIQRTVDTDKDINHVKFPDLATTYSELFYYEKTADNTQIEANVAVVNNNLNTLSQRLSGVMMRNWAFSTAQKMRTVEKPTNKIGAYDDFLTFDDFFRTKEEAKAAWATTIWAKLGFQYEQICSTDSYEKVKFYNHAEETVGGFTTGAGVSSSVISQVSTMFAREDRAAGDDKKFDVATINAGVQVYNNADINVPNRFCEVAFAEPSTGELQHSRTYQYQYSFYDYAVMAPVQTAGKEIQARELPTLSNNGYFLITSNVGGNTDVVHDGSPVVLLDTVPKSNLANQDFIFNRNDLVHTLSNPVNLNSIQINILNPDLSNPTLNPNSSVLLKIDYPVQKPTVIREDFLDQQAIQMLEQGITAEEKAENKQTKQK